MVAACLPYKITHLSNYARSLISCAIACLPYKITHLSNSQRNNADLITACLPYKITHLSNIVISFDNHKKLYTSQTNNMDLQKKQEFDNHKKLHTYQTVS